MMSEKVVITEKQAQAIGIFRDNENSNGIILGIHYKAGAEHLTKLHNEIVNMETDSLVKALYVGYEVEKPPFEVDDIVVRVGHSKYKVKDGTFMKVTEVLRHYVNAKSLKTNESLGANYFNNIRHATKEEIIFAELGREVGEFHEGDTYQYTDGDVFKIPKYKSRRMEYAEKAFKEGNLEGFYPASSFIKLP